ncbi:hypothetical protein L1987_36267 [Smallanthus sonchifolius]|uniref:Uncharacterized protein n=1 Tax=Smallanthus sonchifolius TaxID=185202 RepID=A0ACB9HFI1_9ASTR|nr:hypothetical protein L1987_36267 [Smallanthus sonchifolius]
MQSTVGFLCLENCIWKSNASTPKSKAMGNLDGDSHVVKSQGEETATHHRPSSMVDNRSKRSYVVYAGTLLVMYNVLVQVLRLKYKGRKETPFETQSFLIHTSILAFVVAGLTLPLLIHDYLSTPTRKPFSPLLYAIIKIVCSVTCVVAYLTLVLILIID